MESCDKKQPHEIPWRIFSTNIWHHNGNKCGSYSGKSVQEKTKHDPKVVWPIIFKRFIDDGFGITKGSKTDVEYWIAEFNKLVR